MLTVTIDWIEGTFKEFTNETETFLRTYCDLNNTQTGKPRNGYQRCEVANSGAQLLWNDGSARMGYHVIFPGSALRALLEQRRVDARSLLRAAVDAGLRLSRLDLAKDLTGQAIDGQAVYKRIKSGNAGGSAQKCSRVESENDGETIYVGSRQSERFIRIYNKAAEQNETSIVWWRLEIETKGTVSRLVGDAVLANADIGGIIDASLNKMVGSAEKCSLGKFISRDAIPYGLPKIEKRSDRESWIATQVTPAIAEHFAKNPDSEAVKQLRSVLDLIDKKRKI